MIKTLVLSKMGDNKKALDQINLAINSNSSYARLFLYRFEIRVKLGIATENDWEDADMISFMTLTKLRNWANDNLEF